MTDRVISIGLIGLGYWGPNLARNFTANGARLAWICDRDPDRCARAKKSFSADKVTSNPDDLFSDPTLDAVAIATPVATHSALALAALKAGKHVWVEKPMAGSVAECEEMVRVADAQKRVLMVDHTFIYSAAVRKLHELLIAEQLGDLLYVDSIRVNLGLVQSDVNVVWDLAPHDLSIADYLLSPRLPRSVNAVGASHVTATGERQETVAYVTVHYPGELIVHVNMSWLAPVKMRLTTIAGTKKLVAWNDLDPVEKIKVYDKGITASAPQGVSGEDRRKLLVEYRSGDIWSPVLEQTEPLARAAREFIGSIIENRTPLTDGAAGLRVVRMIEAAQRSMASGGSSVAL